MYTKNCMKLEKKQKQKVRQMIAALQQKLHTKTTKQWQEVNTK